MNYQKVAEEMVDSVQPENNMKTRSKIGGKKGSPAFRTPSSFRVRKDLSVKIFKAKNKLKK